VLKSSSFIMGRLVDHYGRRALFTAAALMLGAAFLLKLFISKMNLIQSSNGMMFLES
jgi:MFS family permease